IQLCYWHVLRAIKKKLTSTGIVYNVYNSYEAHSLCPLIDPTWQPLRQNQTIADHTNQDQRLNEKDKVIPSQVSHLQLLRNNRCMLKWREEFRLEWKKLATHIINPNPNQPGFFKKVIRQEFYPLLKIKEENAFADLPENLHLAFENLNYNYYANEATVHNDDPQVDIDNQEKSVDIVTREATAYNNDLQVDVDVVSSNNQEININNQDAILYQTRKQEIFNLLDTTKKLIEENIMNPNGNKWLDSINKNFEPLRKLEEDYNHFKRQRNIPNTWKN
ncbi:3295_t:CDS:2, partial [Ambispora leptoticha]